jgi:hypothetical protein
MRDNNPVVIKYQAMSREDLEVVVMDTQMIDSDKSENALQQIEREFLDTLLNDEPCSYPWNGEELEAEIYFTELETNFPLENFFDSDELEADAENFFSHLNQC